MAGKREESYMNGYHPSVLKAHSWRTAENSCPHLLPKLKEMVAANPELSMLDVGCGSGSITISLAAYLPKGQVTGVDLSEEPLKFANALKERAKSTNVTFQTASIYELPFADSTFDVIHASQTITHLQDHVRAVKELLRVCKPGGIVAVREGLVRTFTIYPPSAWFDQFAGLAEKQMASAMAETQPGRGLRAIFLHAGVKEEDMTSDAHCYCFANPEDREAHAEAAAQRTLESSFAIFAEKQGVGRSELEEIAKGWREWIEDPAGWLAIMNAEIVVTRRC